MIYELTLYPEGMAKAEPINLLLQCDSKESISWFLNLVQDRIISIKEIEK